MTSDALIDLRRRLHRIPEICYEEHQTAATLRAELDRLGLPHIDGVDGAPTATVAFVGDKAKPCVALRADIDALPISERTGVAYASTHPGRMHACGHDGHSTILMGAAARLKAVAKDLPVSVKLIWQPAEESGGGAQRLVEAGVLDGRIGPKVEAVFGLHNWPGLPLGTVAAKPGAILAATNNFRVTFLGRSCHGAYPHLGIDPIVAAAEAVGSFQQIVSRDLDPTEAAVVTVGMISGGTAVNVIPDTATIEGTVRTLSPGARVKARERMERRAGGIAAAAGCGLRFEWIEGYPVTANQPAMAAYVARTAARSLGQGQFRALEKPSMGGEDFSYYLEKVPGCFFLLGVDPAGGPPSAPLHNDRFDFADASMETGIRMFVDLAANFSPDQQRHDHGGEKGAGH